MKRIISPIYGQLREMTTELKGYEEIRMKNRVIGEACHHRIKDCTEQALKLFNDWMTTDEPDVLNTLVSIESCEI